MGILEWLKNLFKPKETKPVYRSESDNAAIDACMEKTSYGYQINNQKPASQNSDALEP